MTTTKVTSEEARSNVDTQVAFLGPFASYSHQATKIAFPDEKKWELKPTTTIRDVFDVVQAGQARYGVVPFENSTHGTVSFTLDALADREAKLDDVSVCGEVYLDVHHYLLGRAKGPVIGEEKAKPWRADLSHVKRIYSHPQAFGQTTKFVRAHLSGVETIEVSSTSRAAEIASQDETGESAAICGRIAADLFGLDVLAGCVEDREDNTTRFFVLQRGPYEIVPGREQGDPYGGEKYKSLVSFTVAHSTPGALADVLGCFKARGLNLSSINSVPCLGDSEAFKYLFFVEFEGCEGDDPEGRVKGVLQDLGGKSERWRLLGAWRNRRGLRKERGGPKA
ncbi:P-protein [Cladorrhinum samala]|uniref:prephenate dehydratase n=1 Tax=Cladorrhinum samala TaxID=585594 RepID=A0AAV9HR49_9PEZI|nr:P-protein [Cladorrhinum samala]